MLPVLVHDGWQVETVEADLGAGLREWIEIRHADQHTYVTTVAERDMVLHAHGINPADLTEVYHIDDGCE